MKIISFGDLYDFIEKNIDKAMKHNSFELVEEFCKDNDLDFGKLKPVLEYFGGFEDIEVLNNVSESIKYIATISHLISVEKAWQDKRQQAFLEAQAEKHDEAMTKKHDEAMAEKHDEAMAEKS